MGRQRPRSPLLYTPKQWLQAVDQNALSRSLMTACGTLYRYAAHGDREDASSPGVDGSSRTVCQAWLALPLCGLPPMPAVQQSMFRGARSRGTRSRECPNQNCLCVANSVRLWMLPQVQRLSHIAGCDQVSLCRQRLCRRCREPDVGPGLPSGVPSGAQLGKAAAEVRTLTNGVMGIPFA